MLACVLRRSKVGGLMRISWLVNSEVDATSRLAHDCGFHLDLVAELKRSFAHIWVARLTDDALEPEAFMLAWQAASEIDVIAVGTSKLKRRHGLARGLVAELLRFAIHHGLERALLEVRVSNAAALSLYQSFGFVLGRQREQYYSNPTEDGVEMSLDLKCTSLAVSTSQAPRCLEALE